MCHTCLSVAAELGSCPALRLCSTFSGPANKSSFQHTWGSLCKDRQTCQADLFQQALGQAPEVVKGSWGLLNAISPLYGVENKVIRFSSAQGFVTVKDGKKR